IPWTFGIFSLRYFWHTLISTRWVPLTTRVGGGTIPPARPRAHEQRAPPRETGLVGRWTHKIAVGDGRPDQRPLWTTCGLKSDISRGPRSVRPGLIPCSTNFSSTQS